MSLRLHICVATFLTLFFFPGMVKRWRLNVNMRLSMWYYYTGERAVFSTWMISLFPSSRRRRPVCKKRKSKVEKLVKSVLMLIATQVELCFCSWMLKDQSIWGTSDKRCHSSSSRTVFWTCQTRCETHGPKMWALSTWRCIFHRSMLTRRN